MASYALFCLLCCFPVSFQGESFSVSTSFSLCSFRTYFKRSPGARSPFNWDRTSCSYSPFLFFCRSFFFSIAKCFCFFRLRDDGRRPLVSACHDLISAVFFHFFFFVYLFSSNFYLFFFLGCCCCCCCCCTIAGCYNNTKQKACPGSWAACLLWRRVTTKPTFRPSRAKQLTFHYSSSRHRPRWLHVVNR